MPTPAGSASATDGEVTITPAADGLGTSGGAKWRSKHGHWNGLLGGGFGPEVCRSAPRQCVQPQQALAELRGTSARATKQHQPGGGTRARLQNRTKVRTGVECIMSDGSRLRDGRDSTTPPNAVYATRL